MDPYNNVGRTVDMPEMKFNPDKPGLKERVFRTYKIIDCDLAGRAYLLVDPYGRERVMRIQDVLKMGTNLA